MGSSLCCMRRLYLYPERHRCLLSGLLVVMLLIAGCASKPDNAASSRDRASEFDDAAFAAGANQPPNANTLYALSRILCAQGRDNEGEYLLKRIIQQYPDYLPAYSDLAELYVRGGRIDDAITILGTALQRAPRDPVLLNNLGMCFFLQEQYEKAAEHFVAASEAAPRDPTYRANHAAALGMTGQFQAAERLYSEVLDNPQDVEHNLAVLRSAHHADAYSRLQQEHSAWERANPELAARIREEMDE